MSFESRDLMSDVLPARNPPAIPGLLMCVDSTRNEQDAPCADATQPPKKRTPAAQTEMDLALLRRELRQALSEQAGL